MDELLKIINELSAPSSIELTQENKENFYQRIKNIYSNVSFRYSYSELSAILEEKCPEEREQIEFNLREISYLFDDDDDEKIAKFYKLLDHISLESMRLNRMAKVEYFSSAAEQSRQEVNDLYAYIKGKVNQLNRRVDRSYGQIVSILGIFTGIVLSCVFALQLFQSSFSNLKEENFYFILLLVLVVTFALFNTIFMLLFVIGKLTGMTLAVNYNIGKARHKNAINMLRIKYPYVFYFNIVVVVLALLVYIFKCRV